MSSISGKLFSRNRPQKLVLLACAAAAAFSLTTGGPGVVARDVKAEAEPVSPGGPATFRRLSEEQYKHSIAQIFGDDITVPGRFEPDVREDGLLAIGASKVIVTPAGLEQYAVRAKEIAAEVLGEKRRAATVGCAPQSDVVTFDEACASQFLGKYGRLLYRRPLTDREMASQLGLAQRATKMSGSFYKGLEAGLASLLVSPSFVFRLETTEADPENAGARRLDAYSLASRVSFLLWDGPPDEDLLNAAASGALRTPTGLKTQIDRLMASPKLEAGVRAFFADMFGYDQFNGLTKDSALYPIFNPQLRNDAEEQSMRTIVDHLLTRNEDYRDLFVTKKTFLTRSLAALYGVKADQRAFGGWMPYSFPADDPHGGLLTLPAFLMLDPSHEGRSSPTIRGKMIRENFLCQPVPNPPANVNFDLVQDVNDPVHKTARERLTAHQENPVCAGCHAITDPMGLSLENYNPVGKYRTHENGEKIDASGTFDGTDYSNAVQLMSLLRESPSTTSCVVQRVYEYGVGRKVAPGEQKWLEYVDQRFATEGYRFPALLRRIATSPAFQAVAPENLASNSK